MFVFWFDGKKTQLGFEVPFANVPSQSGRYFAGVLRVRNRAAYVQLRLANWQAVGQTRFDDLFLVPLKPPAL
jgi:hypothetical protein